MRSVIVRTAAAAALLVTASATTATAQVSGFEITPLAGYVWGGKFNTSGVTNGVANGDLVIAPAFAWGIEGGYTPNGSTWFELTYLRQSTDISYQPFTGNPSASSSFSTNYIHAGARWEFGHAKNLHPFIGAGLGATIFNSEIPNVGSETDFSVSGQVGVRYMIGKDQKFGIRGTFRGWWTFVPNGTVAGWCSYYACYATEGSSTVAQGEISGGLIITF